MASFVRTEDLIEVLPKTLSSEEIAMTTGVNERRIRTIRARKTEFTDYWLADRICVGLDRIADFHHLEEITDIWHNRKHGIQAYNRENCRCPVCKEAKRLADYRYRMSPAQIERKNELKRIARMKRNGNQESLQPEIPARSA